MSADLEFFLQLVCGITATILIAIVVLWCAEQVSRALWRDGDPKEPH